MASLPITKVVVICGLAVADARVQTVGQEYLIEIEYQGKSTKGLFCTAIIHTMTYMDHTKPGSTQGTLSVIPIPPVLSKVAEVMLGCLL
jgi:hypothetical protein